MDKTAIKLVTGIARVMTVMVWEDVEPVLIKNGVLPDEDSEYFDQCVEIEKIRLQLSIAKTIGQKLSECN